MNANMDEKFKVGIRDAVAEIMAAKEDAERASAIETLLSDSQTTITSLTENLTDKETELATSLEDVLELKVKVEELEAKAEEFKTTISDAKDNSIKLEERASLAETKLEEIAASKALVERMAQLEEAKVAASGDKRELQEDKVRTLSTKEFSAYLTERVELRNELELELREEASKVEEVKPTVEEVDTEAAIAAAGSLNIETASSTLTDKYANFGTQLAANMRKNDER